ncbi:hypothetical protein MPTK1_2g02350 [Marchantia polymorpha subsp. ruderalis]|uniref:Uncharacterized protein n=2 Tax=Marchantia polymorpha TaxID=3197 RepID=A0A176W886_MARPO|nr:hypothetical protein AXG93_684s1090 [Marchantia polymorpha subsp. ruderalis]PTQ30092.1 hypothetical protein MARPO_0130s0042 [Marchantia polymorpha]BBN00815.1 hypothetical protein Mp_2g02350 [Marchantia polymorpha subsp. ruderalis]|eukprot:PTQ30092.1 hypothetical protein MARPO_0130s0042 [Marchantia polymorpha]
MTSSSALVSLLSLLAALMISVAQGACTTLLTTEDAQYVFVPKGLDPGLYPPQGNVPIAQLFAVGAQHYTANGTAWVLTNATADLFNSRFEKVGVHFYLPQVDPMGGQPSWKTTSPPSLVTAKRLFTVQVHTNSIAWALLKATSSEDSCGLFGDVTYVQRLFTLNGLPPSTAPTKINATFSSSYTSFYVFYKQL